MSPGFPEILDIKRFSGAQESAFISLVSHYGTALSTFCLPLLKLLNAFEQMLQAQPWRAVVMALLGRVMARSWRTAALVVALTFGTGLVGVWDGDAGADACLDAAGDHRLCDPAVIRLTGPSIRQVDAETIEAVHSFGASPAQTLFSVQLPLALPTIMAGINQTTMMALSMVVIALMVGAGGLGYQVLQRIQRLEVSRGLLAGVGIVLLAIVFDRIAQGYGRRVQNALKQESRAVSRHLKIRVENVCKIFGPDPSRALGHVKAGMGKAELLRETRHILALQDISLDIPAGKIFVIMGLSGSGKSTLIRLFNRLIDPTDGRIMIGGRPFRSRCQSCPRSALRRRCATAMRGLDDAAGR